MNEKVAFIDAHRDEFGVEPICRAWEDTPAQIAPSSYYAARSRPLSVRAVRDTVLCKQIAHVHADNYGVYGVRKVRATLQCSGEHVAESTVRRLMRGLGLRGVSRAKSPRTTKPAPETDRPVDLVKRAFTATRPNELWVADITYVKTFSPLGICCVCARRVLAPHRRLADRDLALHRPRTRRPHDGCVAAGACRP